MEVYLNEFRKLVIDIQGMTGDENLKNFASGLMQKVRLEVITGPVDFNTAKNIALNVESAIFNTGIFMRNSETWWSCENY